MAKKFSKIYVEITNSCNLACSFCPSGQDLNIKSQTPNELSPTQFESILKKCIPSTEQFALHILGEPTSHSQFEAIILTAQNMNAPLNITTNGTLIHKNYVTNALLSPTVQQVNFSLQSWTNNFKTENVKPYLNRIFDFINRAQSERPDLYINLRLWNYSTPEESVLHNAHFLEPIGQFFNQDLSAIKINVALIKSHRISGKTYLHFDSRFEWPDINSKSIHTTGTCYGLKNHIGILANGTVIPCCLDSNGHIHLGNIYESSFEDIISSERAVRIRQGFSNNQLVEELCQKCQFIRRFDKMAARNSTPSLLS